MCFTFPLEAHTQPNGAEVGCSGKENMTSPIYKTGKQIRSISEFDQSECLFYKVKFGKNSRTIHRSFLISWQYRTLLIWIERGWIHEAEEIICGTGVENA